MFDFQTPHTGEAPAALQQPHDYLESAGRKAVIRRRILGGCRKGCGCRVPGFQQDFWHCLLQQTPGQAAAHGLGRSAPCWVRNWLGPERAGEWTCIQLGICHQCCPQALGICHQCCPPGVCAGDLSPMVSPRDLC